MINTHFSLSMLMFCAAAGTSFAKEDIAEALNERNVKKAIVLQLGEVEKSGPTGKGEALKDLTFLYLKDQDQEMAFATFLEALDVAPKLKDLSVVDNVLYEKAFHIYIDPSNGSPQVAAQSLLKELYPDSAKNRDQPLLHYFIAIAYANLNRFHEFFDHFYRAYTYYPEHYLAYKTKAILHVKLLERTRGEEDRTKQRKEIKRQLDEALKREPRDVMIYRLLISFSPKEEKDEQVRRSLNKILCDNIMVPRSDLMFYVQEAVDAGERDLASRFIRRAGEWYPESRLVAAARDYLNAHK